jgi:hypothetical protein
VFKFRAAPMSLLVSLAALLHDFVWLAFGR